MSYSSEVTADSPVAWWRLDDTSGSTALCSPSTYNGTYTSCTLNADSDNTDRNAAVTFDGSSSYVAIADNDVFSSYTDSGTGEITVEAWIYPTVAQIGWIASKAGSGSPVRYEWGLYTAAGGKAGFVIYKGDQSGGNYSSIATPSGYLELNRWHHVVGTYKHSTTTTSIYVDGALIASSTAVSGNRVNNPSSVRIGGRADGNSPFAGRIDEVAVYSSALSLSRIQSHYDAGKATYSATSDPYIDSVELLMHADGADGSATFTDNSPSPKTPTVTGGAVNYTAYKRHGTASLKCVDGSDYVSWGALSSSTAAADFTAECWFMLPVLTASRTAHLMRGPGSAWIVYAGDSDALSHYKVYFYLGAVRITSATVLTAGRWYHVAVVRSGGVIKLYVDGSQEGSDYSDSTNWSNTTWSVGNSQAPAGGDVTVCIDDARITRGLARYTAAFYPSIAAFPGPTSERSLTVSAGASLWYEALTRSASVDALIGVPSGLIASSFDAAIQRNQKPVSYVGASLQKAGIARSSLLGAALQQHIIKTPGVDSCVASTMLRQAFATSAELGASKSQSLSADFLVQGVEQVFSDSLLLKEISRTTSANAYVALAGLIRSSVMDAAFSSFHRCYAGAALYGTVSCSASSDSAVSKPDVQITLGCSAAIDASGDTSSYIYSMLGAVIQSTARPVVVADVYLARTRQKHPRVGAYLGSVYACSALLGAALSQRQSATLSGGTVVQKAISLALYVGASINKSDLAKTIGVSAYLIAYAADTETLLAHDCEWAAVERPTEWIAPERKTEWIAPERPTEWVVNG